jgi:hypothetical protein
VLNRVDNPWQRLPLQAPFVLPEDAPLVNAFNVSASDNLTLHTELLPEPFLGSPDAPVVLLSLNPGYSPDDLRHHQDPLFASRSRANLLHLPAAYPFYLLAPDLSAPGRHWWDRKLGPLSRVAGREAVARGVLCVEYFPYHSRQFGHRALLIPSQAYSFTLVREALNREAIIVFLRGERYWMMAVPELAIYPHLCRVRSVQNPVISPANCPKGYDRAVAALSRVIACCIAEQNRCT